MIPMCIVISPKVQTLILVIYLLSIICLIILDHREEKPYQIIREGLCNKEKIIKGKVIVKQESGNNHVKRGNMHAIERDNVRANFRETIIGVRSALMTLDTP